MLNNQSGEAITLLLLTMFVITIGTGVVVREQELAHKKAMHSEQYHKADIKKEQDAIQALKKSKLYKI